jgi:hypothetical protein
MSAQGRANISAGMRARTARLAAAEQRVMQLEQQIKLREAERERLTRRIADLETALVQAHETGTTWADAYPASGDRERAARGLLDYVRGTGVQIGGL